MKDYNISYISQVVTRPVANTNQFLIECVSQVVKNVQCIEVRQVRNIWYADYSSAVGSLAGVRNWWECLKAKGPDFGYYPKSAKTNLIIKDNSLMSSTQNSSKTRVSKSQTKVNATFLGSVIGTKSFKEQYTKHKVEGWVKDIWLLWSMYKMIFKQHTQRSPKDYAPDGPISKEQCQIWVNYSNHWKMPSEIVGWELGDAERQYLLFLLGMVG